MRIVFSSPFLAIAWLGWTTTACGEPVPGLPPATSSNRARATLATDPLEGSIDAFGVRMPFKSSVKRQTRSSMTIDVPADLETTKAYISARLATFKTEHRTGEATLTEAIPTAAPKRRLEITLRPTSLSTEVIFVALPLTSAAPGEDPSRRADDAQSGSEIGPTESFNQLD